MSQTKSPIAWSDHLHRTLQLGDSARESVNFPILIEINIFKEMNEGNNCKLFDGEFIFKMNYKSVYDWLYFLDT